MTVIGLAQSHIIHPHSSLSKEVISQREKTRRLLATILIFSIVVAVFLYILQINSIASSGYKIGDLKKEITKLENENKILQVDISNLKSIDVLQSMTKDLKMVKAQDIEYVTVPLSGVVLAK
jgi:cell division protein FtsB